MLKGEVPVDPVDPAAFPQGDPQEYEEDPSEDIEGENAETTGVASEPEPLVEALSSSSNSTNNENKAPATTPDAWDLREEAELGLRHQLPLSVKGKESIRGDQLQCQSPGSGRSSRGIGPRVNESDLPSKRPRVTTTAGDAVSTPSQTGSGAAQAGAGPSLRQFDWGREETERERFW